MSFNNPTKVFADLNEVAKGALSREDSADMPFIRAVSDNYKGMNKADQKKLVKLWFAFFHTLAIPVDKVDSTIDENERRGGNENKGTAPIRDQRAAAPEWKRFMGSIMKGVDPKFQNWAVLSRGIGKDLADAALFLYNYGMTDNKKVTKKGAFLYFITDNQMLTWFGVMVTIGINLMGWIAGGENLDIRDKVDIPRNGISWARYVAERLDRSGNGRIEPGPALSDVQAYFNEALKEYEAKGELSIATKTKYELMLEVFTMVRPSRLFVTQDGVRRKKVPLNISAPVMIGFKAMGDNVKDYFTIPAVDINVKFPIDMNKATVDILKIYNNLIPQFRTSRRGGNDGRLGANESRQMVEFKFKFE